MLGACQRVPREDTVDLGVDLDDLVLRLHRHENVPGARIVECVPCLPFEIDLPDDLARGSVDHELAAA